jgi:hypothetical protein
MDTKVRGTPLLAVSIIALAVIMASLAGYLYRLLLRRLPNGTTARTLARPKPMSAL